MSIVISAAESNVGPYPTIAPSIGSAGKGSIPDGWSFNSDNYGISNADCLFGDQSFPWVKKMSTSLVTSGTFITMGKNNTNLADARTTIGNLTTGQKYELEFSVSTSSSKVFSRGDCRETPNADTVYVIVVQKDNDNVEYLVFERN